MVVVNAQTTYTISGTIRSQQTGETIIGASVKVLNKQTGTTSNEYGFYSLTLPAGTYQLEITAVGLQPKVQAITLDKNKVLNLSLADADSKMDSVTVTAISKGRSISSSQMGIERLTTKEIKNIPVLSGERDVLKAIQLLPGIKSAGDGNAGFYVRGGAADQNLIMLDEAPVYNASHLLGFFSTFNSDAIKTYFNPEPRLALSYVLTPSSSLKASYVRNVQNLHLIAGSTTSRPTDKWVASATQKATIMNRTILSKPAISLK